ncbi:MAG: four helix bundle protein [Opitutaceae bacterium]|nr:four helix bundle protein [Opitutaceae bacterium]
MKSKTYDLEERTAPFGVAIIEFCLGVPANPASAPVINQLVRARTSIGANYCEADDAESKRDFRHKIALCRKEARETKYWLRMIAKAAQTQKAAARAFWKEAKELHHIFATIVRTTDRNLRAAQTAKTGSGISH